MTGSVSTMKVAEIANVPAGNFSNALGGRLAGVTVTQNQGGRPGNGSSISVRALGTWNDASPLYVIDGVIRDGTALNGLDANDVENISVLKDGASAAIYGSRSANGVVLVTTKKGKAGKPVISYSGTAGVKTATKIPETQDAYHQALFINDAVITAVAGGDAAADSRYFTPDEVDYFKTFNYDWMDAVWEDPVVTHHALNVTGGNSAVRYYVGGSYYYEDGAFSNMEFDKYTLRGNIEASISKNLTATLDLNMDLRNDSRPYWRNDYGDNTLYDLFNIALLYSPGMRPPYVDGLPVINDMSTNFMLVGTGAYGYSTGKTSNYEANASLRYDFSSIIQGLSVKAAYNMYNRHWFKKEKATVPTVYTFKTAGEHNHILGKEVLSSKEDNRDNFLYEEYSRSISYQFNGFVNYDRSFGKHDVSAVFVFEQSEDTYDGFNAKVNNFGASGSVVLDQLSTGSRDASNFSINGNGSESGRQSYAGRIHYAYADKYIVETSMRYDGSVKFAPERRWGFFPSGSVAWRISEEDFFKNNVRFINQLKLRGTVGLLGNDAVGGWQWMAMFGSTSGPYYGALSKGLVPGVTPNVDLTWEKSLTWNGGLDAELFNNRLSLSFDIFKRHTYDILGARNNILPYTFGGSLAAENYGVVDSHGFEITVDYRGRIGDNFTYHAGGNLGYAVNKNITIDEPENYPDYLSTVGKNRDRQRGFIYTDIFRTQADLDALPEGYTITGTKPELGTMNYKDIRGVDSDEPDGKITDEDQDWIIEHNVPPVNYGFSLGASWKGFAIDMFFQGLAGSKFMIDYREQNTRIAKTNFAVWNDHWTPENTNAVYPRAERPTGSGYPASTFWTRNGSFLRLKNLDISYTFQKPVLSALGISQLKIFFTGVNLFLLEDHVKDFDPELGTNRSTNSSTNITPNIRSYPTMKSYSVGINFSF
jgi:TonB-linked SusC/RagA family outer membrane protein